MGLSAAKPSSIRGQSDGFRKGSTHSTGWTDLDKFARDVDKAVVAHYDQGYDDR
jgi:hypothetical protein